MLRLELRGVGERQRQRLPETSHEVDRLVVEALLAVRTPEQERATHSPKCRNRRDDHLGESQPGAQQGFVRAPRACEHERRLRRHGAEEQLVENEAFVGQIDPEGMLDAPVAERGATEQSGVALERRTCHLEDVVKHRVERERGVEPGAHLVERLVETLSPARAFEQERARDVERFFRLLAGADVFMGDDDAMWALARKHRHVADEPALPVWCVARVLHDVGVLLSGEYVADASGELGRLNGVLAGGFVADLEVVCALGD